MNDRKKESSINVRELVLDMLMKISAGEEYSHVILRNVLAKYDYLPVQEKAFMKRLLEGTLENRMKIDYVINSVSKVPVKKMKPLIRELLRLSTCQILFMDSVPDSAVCNEAVKLAQKRKFQSLKGFVNGVLRNIVRQKESITYPNPVKNRKEWLSIEYSMPIWLIEKWQKELGSEKMEKVLAGLLSEHKVSMRMDCNSSEAQREALCEELKKTGIMTENSSLLPYAFSIENSEGIANISAFREGRCTVMDVSSMLAVEAAGIRKGDFVADVCAAPGGKMLLAAEKCGKQGKVLARDVSEYKTEMMLENKERMHKEQITIEIHDACEEDSSLFGKADVVLADVPCSGLGVIGKKRDIKYRVTPEDLKSLIPLQKKILDTVQNYVKPGGTLLYSTCTINKEENEQMADWFEAEYPFQRESLKPFLPESLQEESITQGYLQLLPGIHGTDGFFMARFVKER